MLVQVGMGWEVVTTMWGKCNGNTIRDGLDERSQDSGPGLGLTAASHL